MKNYNTFLKLCLAFFVMALISCSEDSVNPAGPNPSVSGNTGDLKLFVIDTAKVNAISMIGTNETTILNKLVNSSSYFSGFSLSPDGKKFVYVNHQMTGQYPNFTTVNEIRIAKTDGTGDTKIYELTNNQKYVDALRYCSDGKIFFTLFENYPANTSETFLMNDDGTGLENADYNGKLLDATDNRNYYLTQSTSGVQIIDPTMDNGAGGVYYSENITDPDNMKGGEFTNDGKYAVIPFKDGNAIKARIIDVVAKTSSTMLLVSNLPSDWIYYTLHMASDSKRGVITLSGGDYIKSKTYVFNSKTGIVNAPFENNDDTVSSVFAW